MIEFVRAICEDKRRRNIVPALATELEIKQELSRRGVAWTAESFRQALERLEANAEIKKHRLLRYNGYSYENISEDKRKEDTGDARHT
jgi:hypothetical protein